MAETPSDRISNKGSTGILGRLKSFFSLTGSNTLRQELEQALESESGDSEPFSPQERLMLRNILGFREVRVDDVMVPRVDIIAVDQATSINEVLRIFKEAGHSRLPLFKETLDEPTGMIHIKDLMGWLTLQAARKETKARSKKNNESDMSPFDFSKVDLDKLISSIKIARPMMFVPHSMPAIDLLKKMQSMRVHLALVIDEYGGTEGLVSIEDLVEEIVGEIEDEHDLLKTPELTQSEDGSYIADARVLIEDFQTRIGKNLKLVSPEDDIDTMGGLVFSLADRIPVRGELVSGPEGLEFEILDVDSRRIKKMRILVKPTSGKRKTAAGNRVSAG